MGWERLQIFLMMSVLPLCPLVRDLPHHWQPDARTWVRQPAGKEGLKTPQYIQEVLQTSYLFTPSKAGPTKKATRGMATQRIYCSHHASTRN